MCCCGGGVGRPGKLYGHQSRSKRNRSSRLASGAGKVQARTCTDRRAEGGARCVDDARRIKDWRQTLGPRGTAWGRRSGAASYAAAAIRKPDVCSRGVCRKSRRRHLGTLIDRVRCSGGCSLGGLGILSQMSVEAFSGAAQSKPPNSLIRCSFNKSMHMMSRESSTLLALQRRAYLGSYCCSRRVPLRPRPTLFSGVKRNLSLQ